MALKLENFKLFKMESHWEIRSSDINSDIIFDSILTLFLN